MKKKLLLGLVGLLVGIQSAFATTCPSAIALPAAPTLPYTDPSIVCGATDDINFGSNYDNGFEAVYTWTPTNSYGNATINYNGVDYSAIFVYNGCPTSGGTLVTSQTGGFGITSVTTAAFNVTAGQTYYIVFDTWPAPQSPCPGSFTLNATIVSAPAAPVQDPTPPTCAAGSSLTVSGTPEANTTWYWQTSATGTSTATPYSGAYAISANGTYYIRSLNTTYNQWSVASSITVSNFPTAAAPPAPTAGANPACMNTTLTAAAPPMGTTYYWQTIVNGVSTANNASTPLNVTSSGTYYISAFDAGTSCWSNTTALPVVISTYTPDQPVSSTNPLDICTGASSAIVSVSAAATSATDTIMLASNFVITPGSSAALNGTLNIPGGATITSSVISFNNVTTVGGTWPSDLSVDITGAVTLGSTVVASVNNGVTNAGPYTNNVTIGSNGAFTVNVDHNYSFGGNASAGSVMLIVAYTVPPVTFEWFDAPTAGNSLGTNSTLETIGTSVLPTATAGTYTFYAQAVNGGCVSPTRLPVVVNVNPVVVTLNPINISCNGLTDGSFSLGTVTCGTAPFEYSLDNGVTFGPIPTNLGAGNYDIIVRDASMGISSIVPVTITEPSAPTALNAFNVTFFNGMLTWTPQGSETTWNVEYGPAGFTPGTGFPMTGVTNDTVPVSGLTEDTDYEFYVQAGCITSSDWAGPFAFSTDVPFSAWDSECGPGFTPIHTTGTALNLTDDSSTPITLTNAVSFQGVSSNTLTVSNNGTVSFGAVTLNPWQTDLDDEEGNVYWQETTIGGDNYLIVEWYNRPRFSGVIGQNVTFEIAFNQTTGEIFYLYEDKVFGGTQSSSDYAGNFATISAIGPMSTVAISYNSQTYLQNNSCVRLYTALCPNVTNNVTITTTTDAQLNWDAGLYGETNWTVVYGYDGFDPSVASEVLGTLPTATSDVFIGGLTQLTCYDAYIYSDCAADALTSDGFLVNFCTKPNCADITGLAGTTDPDSIALTWNWLATSPAYEVTGFNIEYGMTGFQLGSGMTATATGINFADTVFNTALMGSGVYQVYVQAECDVTNDTSNWVGPITVVMPVTNDIVCSQEAIQLGQTYTFNNAGAGVSVNESSIAPPATGAQETDGWINSTLNGTLWYTFVAPPSGSVRINSTAISYNGQAAVYSAINCADFNTFDLQAANDNAIGGTSLAPNFTVCDLTPGATYYIMYDRFDGTSGNFSLNVTEIVLEAGTAAALTEVCYGTNVDLTTTINNGDLGGVWSSDIPSVNASITGSDFESNGLAYQTFDFQYRVTDGCAYDSIISQVKVYAPSNAGEDGTIDACRNQHIDLLAGLNGNADLNGNWYDPSDVALPNSQIVTANFPGQYNYDYISGNGVCPDDTANVVVTVLSCNALSVEENALEEVSLYPNPSTGVVFIESTFTGNFDLVVTDINGRTIQTGTNVTSGTNTVNLKEVERGTYFFKLSTENAEKVFRVVIQ